MMLRSTIVAGVLFVALGLANSRPAGSTEQLAPPAKESPPAGDDALPVSNQGARLYRWNCAFCHGLTGRGDGPDADLFDPPPGDLRSKLVTRQSADALYAKIRDGEQLDLALDIEALQARAREIEALAAHLKRLPTVDWPTVEAGVDLYLVRCERCHGLFGRPPDVLPAGVDRPVDLSDPDFQQSIAREELLEAVRHQRKGMTPLSAPLSPFQAKQVAAFVRLLSPGLELYQRYCTVCHGGDGRGGGPFGEVVGGPPVLDESYFRRRDPEQLRAAIWHMLRNSKAAMPHFREVLSDREIRSIAEYLSQLEPAAPPPH